MLKEIGQFPNDFDSVITADEHSPGFYGADIDPWNY
jgi:hypothetical protein